MGSLGLLGLFFVELVTVTALFHGRVASVWELQFGIVGLLPALAIVLSLLGIGSGGVWRLISQAQRSSARRLVAACAGVFGGLLGYGVGGGRHLAELPARLGFAALLGLVAAGALWVIAPSMARALGKAPGKTAVGLSLAALGCELANALVLVRLYPAFHAALSCLSLIAAFGAALAAFAATADDSKAPAARWQLIASSGLGLVALGGLALLPLGARSISGFDNLRILLLERAPLWGELVNMASRVAPPPPLEATPCPGGDCKSFGLAAPSAKSLDLRENDLLLITIDALRADHLSSIGYERETTPNIDQLAEGGVLFEYAYAPTPHTSYSITSLMTGKYMRPLLLQGAAEDSETWAGLFRTYGYRTAAFYPPAVFFIDEQRFGGFKARGLDFEYRKVEFAEGEARLAQLRSYLTQERLEQRLFLWVHLFGPHEPYEAHDAFPFGARDIDRYDSEIALADDAVGRLVALVRQQRPNTVVIITSDHGEEFGDHGGRYHGTTVYEEQVRVPLIFNGAGVPAAKRLTLPVQTIDVLPTVLAGYQIPRPPRIRGRDLGSLIQDGEGQETGLALAETEQQTLLAEGSFRLICERRIGACRLFDLETDPAQQNDVRHAHAERFDAMRRRLNSLAASHGRFESKGLRAQGKGWPEAILRGVTGDGDAAPAIAALLDDADVEIRRKAAELLFELKRPETAAALRLALSRDEDVTVKRFAALALTRLGQGAPRAYELVKSGDVHWRRLAALALAESGDQRGTLILVEWWQKKADRDFKRSQEILEAFAQTRTREAVWPLVNSLDDVRLRPAIARTLAAIGDEFARGALAKALKTERYQTARVALAESLVRLGAEADLAPALQRFLGVPDPLPGGLDFALRAGILEHVGGPTGRGLAALRSRSSEGTLVQVVVPRGGNNKGVRLLVRARSRGEGSGVVMVGRSQKALHQQRKGEVPRFDPETTVRLEIPAGEAFTETHTLLPSALGAKPGRLLAFVLYADRQVEVEALAAVPLSDELPPPAPEAWDPSQNDSEQDRR